MAMIARPTRFRRESFSALKNTIAAGIPNSKARNSIFIRFIVISYAQRHGSGDPTPCGGYPATDCWEHIYSFLIGDGITPLKKTITSKLSTEPL